MKSTRQCCKCGAVLPIDSFYIRNGIPRTDCKKCFNAMTNGRRDRTTQERPDDPHVEMTLDEIGSALGVSRQHAHRLLSSALTKVRDGLKEWQ